MENKTRINFVIGDQKKDSWENYVESTAEFETLSHFLRVAAQREIQDDSDHQPAQEVIKEIDELQAQIESLSAEIQGINARLDSEGTDIELIADDVRRALPTLPEPTPSEVVNSDKSADQLQTQFAYNIVKNNQPTTINGLSKTLGEDRKHIEQAIRQLKSDHVPLIEKVLDDGEKHFFKQGERR